MGRLLADLCCKNTKETHGCALMIISSSSPLFFHHPRPPLPLPGGVCGVLAGPPASDERQTLPEAAAGLQQQGQPEGEQRCHRLMFDAARDTPD